MKCEITYEHLLEGMNDPVFVLDTAGKIQKVNSAASEGYGYGREEFEAMCFHDLFPKEDSSHFKNKLDEVLKRGELRFKCKNITKYGEEITIEFDASVIDFEEEKAVLAVARDITEQEELKRSLERSEEKYENLLDRVLEGVLIIDEKGYLKEINPSGVETLGYDKNELLSMRIREILAEDSIEKLEKTLERMKDGRGVSGLNEFQVIKKDGSKIWIEAEAAFMEKGDDSDLIQGVFRDITERKKAKKQLKKKNKSLKELLKERENIIKRLNHDLKTPVSPLVNLLPLVKEEIEEEVDNTKVLEDLEVCHKNALYLKDLLEHILKVAEFSMSGRKGEKEEFDLSALLDGWIKKFEERNIMREEDVGIIADVDEDIDIRVDKMGFYEVLENLVLNSIEHMPDGGEVIFKAEERDDFIIIKMEDTGTGMQDEDLEKIFKYFYTKGESDHRLESTGLGLPISRYIIENHGGKIWAENKEGRGSRFCIKLPKDGGAN